MPNANMPTANMPSGKSAIASGAHAADGDLAWAETILGAVGIVERLPESLLDVFTGVAGSGPAASRLAGRIAEGYISTSGKATELYTEKLLPAVAEGLEKAGRADGDIERMIEMKVSFDTDKARAMEDTKIWAALALSGEQKVGVEDPREMEQRLLGNVS